MSTRINKANLRNNVYPRNVRINGVNNETFRIFDVVADGRCLFGTIWLLAKEPSEINRLLHEDTDTYKEIEDFNDNDLNNFIETIFGTMTHCDKIKMMESFFLASEPENSQISRVIGPYEGVNPNIERYCNTDSRENTKKVEQWYQDLSKSGVVGKFDEYLLSLHTNQTPFEDFEESYRYSDIELLANFLSDNFNVNINLINTTGKTPYEGEYNVYMRYIGKPNSLKRDIYIYYKAAGHFQPMIPNSILKRDIRPPVAQQTSANVSSSKRKTQAPDENNPIESLKKSFPSLGTDIITQVYEANRKDFAEAYHHLAVMVVPEANPYAVKLKQLTDMGFPEVDATNALDLVNGDFNFALETLTNKTGREPKAPRNASSQTILPATSSKGMLDTENFIFKSPLKIKYAINSDWNNLKDLPSTGSGYNPFSKGYSTTSRITGDGDSVYSKTNYNLKNKSLFQGYALESGVEVCNGAGVSQPPENWGNATDNWYFRVNLVGSRTGGRTRKRHPKRARVRSQKKRKMRILKRQTKRPRRLSQTKRQKQ